MKKIAINAIFLAGCVGSFCLFYIAAANIDRIFLSTIK